MGGSEENPAGKRLGRVLILLGRVGLGLMLFTGLNIGWRLVTNPGGTWDGRQAWVMLCVTLGAILLSRLGEALVENSTASSRVSPEGAKPSVFLYARVPAQEFFARVLAGNSFAHVDPEKGRFRSFLLGGLRHFLSDLRDRNRAEKRGWGMEHEPLGVDTDTSSGADVADRNEARPEEQFDREWALAVTARALQVVAGEFEGEGRGKLFQELKPWLVGSAAAPPQEAVATALGISEGALKVAIHRLRKRFREAVRREVAQTVPDFADVDAELRYLVDVLARG